MRRITSPRTAREQSSSSSGVMRTGTSPRNNLMPRPPGDVHASGHRYPTSPSNSGSVLPVLALPPQQQMGSTLPAVRTPSPGTFKRQVWSTPRGGESLAAQTPPRRNSQDPGDNDPSYLPAVDPYADSSSYRPQRPDPSSSSYAEPSRAPPDALYANSAEQAQLAYMDQMYGTIQMLNSELDRERQERAQVKMVGIEDQVDAYAHAMLSGMAKFSTADMNDEITPNAVVMPIPLAPPARKSRPQRPIPQSLQGLQLAKDQVELCAALGKNAELRIRSKQMEQSSEKTAQELEQAQKQMKLIERRVSNREEKLRILLKEKLHWQKEMKDMRDHVVEEKMRQVDLFRRMETAKREHAAQMDAVEQALRDAEEDNQSLRTHIGDIKAQMNYQTKKMDDLARQAKEEKEKFVACIAETRFKFKGWRDGEAVALKNSRDQAIHNLKTEYDLKMARHQDEKQKLREKVKDLEVSLRLMQKDRTLSPLELSLRKATILGSKDHAGTTEAELIEAHSRIRELESLLEHSQEFQRRQENIIKVSESTISRLMQEREVTALENLSLHPLIGGVHQSNMLMDDNPYAPSSYPASPPRESPMRPNPKNSAHDAPNKRAGSGIKPKPSATSSSTGQLRKGIDSPGRFVSPSGMYTSSSAAFMDARNLGSQPSPFRPAPSDPRPRFDDRRLDDYMINDNGYGLASTTPPAAAAEDTDRLMYTADDVQASGEDGSNITIPSSPISPKEQFLLNELARLQQDLDEARSAYDRVKDHATSSVVDIDANQSEITSSDAQADKELNPENCEKNSVEEPIDSPEELPAQVKSFETVEVAISQLPMNDGESIDDVTIEDMNLDSAFNSFDSTPTNVTDETIKDTLVLGDTGEHEFNSVGDDDVITEVTIDSVSEENLDSSTEALHEKYVEISNEVAPTQAQNDEDIIPDILIGHDTLSSSQSFEKDGIEENQALEITEEPNQFKDLLGPALQVDSAAVTSSLVLEDLELIKTLASSYGADVPSETVREVELLVEKLASSLSSASSLPSEEVTSTNEDVKLPMYAELPACTSSADAKDICPVEGEMHVNDGSGNEIPIVVESELQDGSLEDATSLATANESMLPCSANAVAIEPPNQENSYDEREQEISLTQEHTSTDDCIKPDQADEHATQPEISQAINSMSDEARAAVAFMTVLVAEACTLVSLKRKELSDPPSVNVDNTHDHCMPIASEGSGVSQSFQDSSVLVESSQMPVGSDEARMAVIFMTILDAEACTLVSMKRKECSDPTPVINDDSDDHCEITESEEANVLQLDDHCGITESTEDNVFQPTEAVSVPIEIPSLGDSTGHNEARTAVAFVAAMGAEACAIVTVKRNLIAHDIIVDTSAGPDDQQTIPEDAFVESNLGDWCVETEPNATTDIDEEGFIVIRDPVDDAFWPVGAFSRDISTTELPVVYSDIPSNESASDECQKSSNDSNEQDVIEPIPIEVISIEPAGPDEPLVPIAPPEEDVAVEEVTIAENAFEPLSETTDTTDDTEIPKEQPSDEPVGLLDVSFAKPVSLLVPDDHVRFIAPHMAFAFVSAIKAGACTIVALKRSIRKELEDARAQIPIDPLPSTHAIESHPVVASNSNNSQPISPRTADDNPLGSASDSESPEPELQENVVAIEVSETYSTDAPDSPELVTAENPAEEIIFDAIEEGPMSEPLVESISVRSDERSAPIPDNFLDFDVITGETTTDIFAEQQADATQVEWNDTSVETEDDIVIGSDEVVEAEEMMPNHTEATSSTELDCPETAEPCEDVVNALNELINIIAVNGLNTSQTPDETVFDTTIDEKGDECFPETMFDVMSSADATFATPLDDEESIRENMRGDNDADEARVVFFNEGVGFVLPEYSSADEEIYQELFPESCVSVDFQSDADPDNDANAETSEVTDALTYQEPVNYVVQNPFTYAAYDLDAIEYNLQVILGAIDATAQKIAPQSGVLLSQDVRQSPTIPFAEIIPDDFKLGEAQVCFDDDGEAGEIGTSNVQLITKLPIILGEVDDVMAQILDYIENEPLLSTASSLSDENETLEPVGIIPLVDIEIIIDVEPSTPLADFTEAESTQNMISNEFEAIASESNQPTDSLPSAMSLADIESDGIADRAVTDDSQSSVNIMAVQEVLLGMLNAVQEPIDSSVLSAQTSKEQSVEAETTSIAQISTDNLCVDEVSGTMDDIQTSLIPIDVEDTVSAIVNNAEVLAHEAELPTEELELDKPATINDAVLVEPYFRVITATNNESDNIQPSQMLINDSAVEDIMKSMLSTVEETVVDVLLRPQKRTSEEFDSEELIHLAEFVPDEMAKHGILVNSQNKVPSIMPSGASSTDSLEGENTVLSMLDTVAAILSESRAPIDELDEVDTTPTAELANSNELMCEMNIVSLLEVEDTLRSMLESVETTIDGQLLSVATEPIIAPVESIISPCDEIPDEMTCDDVTAMDEPLPTVLCARELEIVAFVSFVPVETASVVPVPGKLISNEVEDDTPPSLLPDGVEVKETVQSILFAMVTAVDESVASLPTEASALVQMLDGDELMRDEVTRTDDNYGLVFLDDVTEVDGTVQSIVSAVESYRAVEQSPTAKVITIEDFPLQDIVTDGTSKEKYEMTAHKVEPSQPTEAIHPDVSPQVNGNAESVPVDEDPESADKIFVLEDASTIVEAIEDVVQAIISKNEAPKGLDGIAEVTKMSPGYSFAAENTTEFETAQPAEIPINTFNLPEMMTEASEQNNTETELEFFPDPVVTTINSLLDQVIRSSVATLEQSEIERQSSSDNEWDQMANSQDHSLSPEKTVDDITESTHSYDRTANEDEINDISKTIIAIVETIESVDATIEAIAHEVASNEVRTPQSESLAIDSSVDVNMEYTEPQASRLQPEDIVSSANEVSTSTSSPDVAEEASNEEVINAISDIVEVIECANAIGKTATAEACTPLNEALSIDSSMDVEFEFEDLKDQSLPSASVGLLDSAEQTINEDEIAEEVSKVANDIITEIESADDITDGIAGGSTVDDISEALTIESSVKSNVSAVLLDTDSNRGEPIFLAVHDNTQPSQPEAENVNEATEEVSQVLAGLCERVGGCLFNDDEQTEESAGKNFFADLHADVLTEVKLVLEEIADTTATINVSDLKLVSANSDEGSTDISTIDVLHESVVAENETSINEAEVDVPLLEKPNGCSNKQQSELELADPNAGITSVLDELISGLADNDSVVTTPLVLEPEVEQDRNVELDPVAVSVMESLIGQMSVAERNVGDLVEAGNGSTELTNDVIQVTMTDLPSEIEPLEKVSTPDKRIDVVASARSENNSHSEEEGIISDEVRDVLGGAICALVDADSPPNAILNTSTKDSVKVTEMEDSDVAPLSLDDISDIGTVEEVAKVLEEALIAIESSSRGESPVNTTINTPTEPLANRRMTFVDISETQSLEKITRMESTVSDLLRSVTDSNPNYTNMFATDNNAKRRTSDRRRASSRRVMESFLFDPTLLAYDVHHEQSQPFSLMDDSLFNIDPNAQHMQYDENDRAVIGITEVELIAKKKRMDYDKMRKSIAYRSIPAFNYAQLVIKFQWSDFVVATPIDVNDKSESLHLPTSPVQKMRLLSKKGVKLPCGSYVIVSAFIRPLEDGNENLRVQIYDSEWVEEFQYDFSEDHLRDYLAEWIGSAEDAKTFLAKLEFRREEGSIIIRLPEKFAQVQDDDNEITSSTPLPVPSTPTLTMVSSRDRLESPYHLSTHPVHQHSWPVQPYECIDECDESRGSIASNSMRGD